MILLEWWAAALLVWSFATFHGQPGIRRALRYWT
jgi:hypothetical protein